MRADPERSGVGYKNNPLSNAAEQVCYNHRLRNVAEQVCYNNRLLNVEEV